MFRCSMVKPSVIFFRDRLEVYWVDTRSNFTGVVKFSPAGDLPNESLVHNSVYGLRAS